MRKLTLITIFCICAAQGSAQIPTVVHDPVNWASIGEMILQAEEAAHQMQRQLAFAEKAAEKVEKVNNLIKTIKLAEETINRGVRMIDRIEGIKKAIERKDKLSAKYVATIIRRCVSAVDQILSNLLFIENVLGIGLNMSDNERIMQMQRNLNAINLVANSIKRLEVATERLYQKKQLFERF